MLYYNIISFWYEKNSFLVSVDDERLVEGDGFSSLDKKMIGKLVNSVLIVLLGFEKYFEEIWYLIEWI